MSILDVPSLPPRIAKEPTRAWMWSQHWRDVLFLHWPTPYDWIRSQIPQSLEVDTFAGQAWVSHIGFRLQQVRLRGCPPLPYCSQMLELNLRTYVHFRGEPAIYFLTMHADHRLMIAAARWLTPLPYEWATLTYTARDGVRDFVCQPGKNGGGRLHAVFRPRHESGVAEVNTLDAWLVERYTGFAADARGRLFRMAVKHGPWPLQHVQLRHYEHGLEMLQEVAPRCHFSRGVESLLWSFERIDDA